MVVGWTVSGGGSGVGGRGGGAWRRIRLRGRVCPGHDCILDCSRFREEDWVRNVLAEVSVCCREDPGR